MGFKISNLEYKCMHAIVFTFNNQLCPHYSHVGKPSKISNPELHWCSCWRIEHKFLRWFIKSSGSFNSSNIRSMSELCESITSKSFKACSFKKYLIMFFSSKSFDRLTIKTKVNLISHCWSNIKLKGPRHEICMFINVISNLLWSCVSFLNILVSEVKDKLHWVLS